MSTNSHSLDVNMWFPFLYLYTASIFKKRINKTLQCDIKYIEALIGNYPPISAENQ